VQIYFILIHHVRNALGKLFREWVFHLFHGRREEIFSDTRRRGPRSDGKQGRTEIKDCNQTPSRVVEVSYAGKNNIKKWLNSSVYCNLATYSNLICGLAWRVGGST